MTRAALMTIFLMIAVSTHAAEPLVGDRPDFTESALSVAPGSVQLKVGATLDISGLGDHDDEHFHGVGLVTRF